MCFINCEMLCQIIDFSFVKFIFYELVGFPQNNVIITITCNVFINCKKLCQIIEFILYESVGFPQNNVIIITCNVFINCKRICQIHEFIFLKSIVNWISASSMIFPMIKRE